MTPEERARELHAAINPDSCGFQYRRNRCTLCEEKIVPFLAQVQAEVLGVSHRSDDLDCDCKACLKNVIKQLEHQVDIERRGYFEARSAALEEAFNLRPGLPKEWDSAQFREGYYSGLEAFRQAIKRAQAAAPATKETK